MLIDLTLRVQITTQDLGFKNLPLFGAGHKNDSASEILLVFYVTA
jgi:hypothetical protein